MARPIIPLIMCGGAGTRLWPASRENRPKQFLPLFGPLSTFQETIRRVSDSTLFGRAVVVTNAQYRFLVAEQLAAIGAQADILLEPARRDFFNVNSAETQLFIAISTRTGPPGLRDRAGGAPAPMGHG